MCRRYICTCIQTDGLGSYWFWNKHLQCYFKQCLYWLKVKTLEVVLRFILLPSLANGSLGDTAWLIHFLRCFQLVWHYHLTISQLKTEVNLRVISPVSPPCVFPLLKLYILKVKLLQKRGIGRQGVIYQVTPAASPRVTLHTGMQGLILFSLSLSLSDACLMTNCSICTLDLNNLAIFL